MSDPDVVIPVRPGDRNEELRYALRSIDAFLPHGRVWLAGHAPRWTRNIEHVPTRQSGPKHENSLKNLLTACQHPDVSENFILWNDDFFLLETPFAGVPLLHRGPAWEHLASYGGASSQYLRNMKATIEILALAGLDNPLSYELHVPMPVTKAGILSSIETASAKGMPLCKAPQIRTLYGNLIAGGDGAQADDVKIFEAAQVWTPGPLPYLSTMDHLWARHPAAKAVRALLPNPCQYEEEHA